MSLRVRLFLMLSSLVLLLVLAQWWWVKSLARGLTEDVDAVALEIGNSVADALAEGVDLDRKAVPEQRCAEDDPGCEQVMARHERIGHTTRQDQRVIEERTIVVRGNLQADDEVSASANFWVSPVSPSPATKQRHTVAYSLQVADAHCPDDAQTCLEDMAEEVFMLPAPGHAAAAGAPANTASQSLGPGRHLVLHLDRWPSSTGFAAHAAASGPRDLATGNSFQRVRFIPIPDRGVQTRLDRFSSRLLLGSGVFFLFGLLAAAVVAQRVSAPLRRLSEAAERVGEGALGTRVDAGRADPEVGRALAAFNRMSGRLARLDRAHRDLVARQHLGEIGDIAHGLAHSLRNPLNALGLSLEEIAAHANEGPQTTSLVSGARRQIRRIDRSVRSFLALASHGGTLEAVDVAELTRDVALEVLQDAAGGRRVEVDAEDVSIGNRAMVVEAIAPELRAVLQALMVNAVEASPAGAVVRVAVSAAGTGRVRVSVTDHGPGLPAAIRQHLFTPHQTTKAHGSGMGLFLAHRIATTRYAGSLRLEDRDGGGTRAVLEFGARREGDHEPAAG